MCDSFRLLFAKVQILLSSVPLLDFYPFLCKFSYIQLGSCGVHGPSYEMFHASNPLCCPCNDGTVVQYKIQWRINNITANAAIVQES